MEAIYENCAGLDVHKKTVVACRMRGKEGSKIEVETRTFETMTGSLLTLLDWLREWQVTIVSIESTGEYWKPVFNILEGNIEVWLVNAQHVKTVPGRKTDVKDAEWLARLMRFGLVRPSFIPPQGQRDLRDLTRQRVNLVSERADVVNRLQKVLENANIKLASVATDITGVSARAMLAEIIAGNEKAEIMAELARASLRKKIPQLQAALVGRVREHHRFMLAQHLSHIDYLDEQITTFNSEIEARMPKLPAEKGEGDKPSEGTIPSNNKSTFDVACDLLDAIPGISTISAQQLLAEIGTDMSQFPSARHLSSWAGVCPGNNQSGGKRRSGKIVGGDRPIRRTLVQMAHAAARTNDTYFSGLYKRIMLRRGKKRGIIAVAHAILVTAYHMLKNGTAYKEHDTSKYDIRQKQRSTEHLVKRLEKLGHKVILSTASEMA